MKTLFVLNDPAYGTERSYNGLRLANALAKRNPLQATDAWTRQSTTTRSVSIAPTEPSWLGTSEDRRDAFRMTS